MISLGGEELIFHAIHGQCSNKFGMMFSNNRHEIFMKYKTIFKLQKCSYYLWIYLKVHVPNVIPFVNMLSITVLSILSTRKFYKIFQDIPGAIPPPPPLRAFDWPQHRWGDESALLCQPSVATFLWNKNKKKKYNSHYSNV